VAVPSFDHDILVELFRRRGEIAAALLQACAVPVVDYARVELRSIDLSQVVSTEYRADAVVVLRDAQDGAAMGVIIEVQRWVTRGKRLTWPVYLTTLRAEYDCPVVLLVVTPDPDVAAWARRPIELGHPGFCLTPVVIGFDDVPRILDRGDARRLPELAVLSAMAHPDLEVAEIAIEAISRLPEAQSRLYFDVIMSAVPEAIRHILEAQMEGYKYKSEFAIRYYSQGEAAGLEQGLERGLEQGLEQGLERGLEQGLKAAVLTLARAKVDALMTEDVSAIEGIRDRQVLEDLVEALGRARSAAEAREVLDIARGYSNSLH